MRVLWTVFLFATCIERVTAQASSVTWTGKIQSNEAAAGHWEGAAMAGSPSYLFVGAPFADGGFPGSGAVYFVPGALYQKIYSLDPNCLEFGASIALTQDLVAVGAPASLGGDGMVKVYSNSMGYWVDYATVRAPVDAWSAGAQFGYSVAISFDKLFVGAPTAGNQLSGGPGPGAVYIFDDNGNGYTYVDRVLGATNKTRLGESVDVSGTRFVAGRPNDPVFANVPGSALVYVFNGATWNFEVELAGTSTIFDGFGTDVDYNGTRLVVGAPEDGMLVGAHTGRAYLFSRNGSTWTPDGVLRPANGADGDGFGTRVALDSPLNATRVLVAAPGSDFAGADSGSVHLFVRNATQWYNTLAEFAAGETVAGDRFGGDVTFGGGKACVGAPLRADFGPGTGAVYTFNVVTPRIYCSSQVNSQGCTPSMSFNGQPSPNAALPFTLSASLLLNQKPGLFFYGHTGAQSVPLFGGTLCANTPIRRTPPQGTGGSTSGVDCSGQFSFDFSSWAQSGADPGIVPGVKFNSQIWSRDLAAGGSNLTDAVEFTWLP